MDGSCVQVKRARSANYTVQEKKVLLKLINKYRIIIGNTKTDAATNHAKDLAWQQIGNEFNSQSPSFIFRDAQALRKTYQNLKKRIRKEALEERVPGREIGGGSSPKSDPVKDLARDTINKETAIELVGLKNPYDSDSPMTLSKQSSDGKVFSPKQITSPLRLQDNHEAGPKDNEIIFLEVEEIDDMEAMESRFSANEEEASSSCSGGPWQWKTSNLKQPINGKLTETVRPTLLTGTSENQQRVVPALHSNELNKLYHQLALERLEVARTEKQLVIKRLQHEDEQHQLKCAILKEELKSTQRLNNRINHY